MDNDNDWVEPEYNEASEKFVMEYKGLIMLIRDYEDPHCCNCFFRWNVGCKEMRCLNRDKKQTEFSWKIAKEVDSD